ncbi:hypothetical protein K450DRAFT_249352 [Umbelopsis ramanniana AG]|uniref:NAD-dependent epimerase/dehydratase domain-containing protein n=1 Tax=Umbelopsis ramanniana AG TaxID=1314678 RepID=A0AAD5HBG4_UMBRA|nr:uncharacterized protein K450DRAFT_249352 [Umbelopsis ramanniana AG]KAI8577982.1 hypothetical protein K450DRAFT_249352 [Umbelopsis ramanniana AG]
MSSLKPGSRVLVTGVTGYIGTHVADQLLKAGYVVIGTSRTASKAETVKKYFDATYGPGKFEIYEAGDLQQAGVFDDAVKDVEAIAHVASPVIFSAKDPFADVINPAVKGTLSLLNSAHKYGKHVKHVVVTSSVASIMDPNKPSDYVYSEADWNDEAIKTIQRQVERGDTFEGPIAYRASKNEAERAIWKFRDENQPSFTLATILPSFVFGAILPPPTTTQAVDATSTPKALINYYTGESQDPTFSTGSSSFVNVVDVAVAHVLALQNAQKTNGQRYITSQGAFTNQEVVDILRREYPDRQNIIAKGEPGKYKRPTVTVDGSKVTRELGLQYTDFETVVLQTIECVKHLY